jgi:hypothetical protein
MINNKKIYAVSSVLFFIICFNTKTVFSKEINKEVQVDTNTILSDTIFHYGGDIFHIDSDFGCYGTFYNFEKVYGQYKINQEGKKILYGKCLFFPNTNKIRDEFDEIVIKTDKDRVTKICYYDNEGILLKIISIGYTSRKIISIWEKTKNSNSID